MVRCPTIISCCDLPVGISDESSKESSLIHSYNVSYKFNVSSYSKWTIVHASKAVLHRGAVFLSPFPEWLL